MVECKKKMDGLCEKPEGVGVIKKARIEFDMRKDFVRPDKKSKCTWHVGADPKTSPHTKIRNKHTDAVLPNILYTVGNTPLIKLNKIPQSAGIKCEMYAKCEFFNPGGSVKDRIGYRMVEDAERLGLLKPGYTVIEPTSGNTGIGLALACAVKGYNCVIVMPEKMSDEKVNTLRALGATIYRTPTEASFDSPQGLIAVSQKLQKETPNSIILDQYRNASNPLAHYDTTADEIIESLDGKLDMVICGAGTGGTLSGVGRRIKEVCPSCVVVAADPEGSILALPESLNKTDVEFYEVEGIGYDFVPTVLDRSVADIWIKCNDQAALPMAKRIIREEGLLCGGSSGFALATALQAAKDLKEGQKCVVILPDGIRNYMTKFVSDQWMEARNLKPCVNTNNHPWWDIKVAALIQHMGHLQTRLTVPSNKKVSETLQLMKEHNCAQIPVIDAHTNDVIGIASASTITQKLMNKFADMNSPILSVLQKKFYRATPDTNLGLISRIMEIDQFVLVSEKTKAGNKNKETVFGILTNVEFLNYINDYSSKNGQ